MNKNVCSLSSFYNIPFSLQQKADLWFTLLCIVLLAAAERERISEEKRIKGNEYFKAKDYPLAVKYYSESIAIQDTAAAYCNRALACK